MRALLETIERTLPDGGDWCSLEKATTLAALVVGLRPLVTVEIGVWLGGSLIPTLLALRHVHRAHPNHPNFYPTAVAIDPWSPAASASGETEKNAAWWSSVDHEAAYRRFVQRLIAHELGSYCRIERAPSDEVTPPATIDLLHIDGNHRSQALRDVQRFCPHVCVGGICILDDVGWEGGHVDAGIEHAKDLGFTPMYRLDKGLVMQRSRP